MPDTDNVGVKPNTSGGAVSVATWFDTVNEVHVPVYLDWEHYMIHAGKMFFTSRMWGEGAEVADNASVDILLQAGASGMHIVYEVSAGGNAEVHFYKAPTFSDAGTSMTHFNKNEYSTNTSDAAWSYAPTITDVGTALPAKLLVGGTGGNAAGGKDGSFSREFIAKDGSDYLVRITNRAGQPQPVEFSVEWYEL